MTPPMFPLIHGNPTKNPASFTRFVLPFAYKLLRDDGDGAMVYEREEEPDEWRRRYLTTETGRVLFERARWFRLAGLTPQMSGGILNLQGSRRVRAEMAAPRLVLFEYPESGRAEALDELRTGLLIIELFFPDEDGSDTVPPELDDLLLVNELFRYCRKPYPQHDHDDSDPSGKSYAKFLKDWPHGKSGATLGEKSLGIQYRGRWQSFLTLPVQHSAGQFRKLICGGNSDWSIHADDRTYVWTCALIEDGGSALRGRFSPPKSEAADYGHWIKLLNVDAPGKTAEVAHQTRQFERDWAAPLTYRRWEEWGTFYGFTPHSGAMLGPPNREPPLWKHFGQMYFDQIVLLLYVRTTLFRFSEEITRISAKARDAGEAGDEDWRKEFETLRRDFALFTNLYQFPLLSNQQQAVEMYGLAREAMDVKELFSEIQSEIHASHDYLVMLDEQRQAEMSTLLTAVATGGLIVGLATGILGMNVLIDTGHRNPSDWWLTLGTLGGCTALMLLGIIFAKPVARRIRQLIQLRESSRRKRTSCKAKTP